MNGNIISWMNMINNSNLISKFPDNWNLIQKYSQKIKFYLGFIFSIVRQREIYLLPSTNFYYSDIDIYYLIQDII